MADLAMTHPEGGTPPEAFGPNFNRVARMYRWAEYLLLGPLLRRTREHFLPEISWARQALVLGDGDGRFLAELLRRAPELQAVAVDGSAGMLDLLERRCSFAGSRVTTLECDFTSLPLNPDLSETDLVVTHFALDCLSTPDLARLVTMLSRRLRSGTIWIVSDFAIPDRQPWRFLASLYVRGLYLAFRLLTGLRTQTLPDVPRIFEGNGFHRRLRTEWMKGLLYSEMWQLG